MVGPKKRWRARDRTLPFIAEDDIFKHTDVDEVVHPEMVENELLIRGKVEN